MPTFSSSHQKSSGGNTSRIGYTDSNGKLKSFDYFEIGSGVHDGRAGKRPGHRRTASIRGPLAKPSSSTDDKRPPVEERPGKHRWPTMKDMSSTGFSIAGPREPRR